MRGHLEPVGFGQMGGDRCRPAQGGDALLDEVVGAGVVDDPVDEQVGQRRRAGQGSPEYGDAVSCGELGEILAVPGDRSRIVDSSCGQKRPGPRGGGMASLVVARARVTVRADSDGYASGLAPGRSSSAGSIKTEVVLGGSALQHRMTASLRPGPSCRPRGRWTGSVVRRT